MEDLNFTVDDIRGWLENKQAFLNGEIPNIKNVEEIYFCGYTLDDIISIATKTEDDYYMYDLQDQLDDESFSSYDKERVITSMDFFRDKRLGIIIDRSSSIKFDGGDILFCLDNNRFYWNNVDSHDRASSYIPCINQDVYMTYMEFYNFSKKLCEENAAIVNANNIMGLDMINDRSEYGTVSEAHDDIFIKQDSEVKYSGYKKGLYDVQKIINHNTVRMAYRDLGIPPKYNKNEYVNVVVMGSLRDNMDTNPSAIIILSKDAYKDGGYSGTYDTYLLCNLYAYILFQYNPKAMSETIYAIAKWKSGLFNEYKEEGLPVSTYNSGAMLDIIYNKYGWDGILDVIKNGNTLDGYKKYAFDIGVVKLKNLASMLGGNILEADTGKEKMKQDLKKDWSLDGVTKLVRRIKMGSRKAIYKTNSVAKDIEDTVDPLTPTPDVDLDKDGEVEASERKVHSADLYPTKEKIASKIQAAAPAATGNTDDNKKEDKAPTVSESLLIESGCNYIKCDDKVIVIEDKAFDAILQRNLYQDRMKRNTELLSKYANVKNDMPFIKYTFIDMAKYKSRNMYYDLSYYNEIFFKNNMYSGKKGKDLYLELIDRLVNDSRLQENGYTKKTIIIPVLDWDNNPRTKMWIYNQSINPISIIYDLMKTNLPRLKEVFGGCDVLFCGPTNYFKINFSHEYKGNMASVFLTLVRRLIDKGYDCKVPDPDPEGETKDSPKAIAMDIINKLEKTKNIKIDDNIKLPEKLPTAKALTGNPIPVTAEPNKRKENFVGMQEPEPTNDKKTKEQIDKDSKDEKKEELVKAINKAAEMSADVDDALDKLDDARIKRIIADLSMEEENSSVSKARAKRMQDIRSTFTDKEVHGKSVKEMLDEGNAKAIENQIEETALPISSINEEWKHLKFMNFDKKYDIDKHVVKILYGMSEWTYPIGVLNIDVQNNSTSEDYVNLWTVKCEDSFGKRFTLKFDVPIFMEGNKYMRLRGNDKTIETQYTLMPIIKTDENDAQIVSNYNKIFIRRYNTTPGKSSIYADKIVRGLAKLGDNPSIKVTKGDNSKICSKYDLPMDYIDLAQLYDKIELRNTIFYFNQDEIREKYKVQESKGIPIGVYKNGKDTSNWEVIYKDEYMNVSGYICDRLYGAFPEFKEISDSLARPTKYTYSRASILSTNMPLILVAAHSEGLTKVLSKAKIDYELLEKLPSEYRKDNGRDWIRFNDGYLVYHANSSSTLLMNGLKECDTMGWSLADINNKSMYVEFLDDFGGRIKSDGLDNFYDCMIDPITKEVMKDCGLPTDYVEALIYANNLLVDNSYFKHGDATGRRMRRAELIAGYVYKAITDSYCAYSVQCKHTRNSTAMSIKQSAVIDRIFLDPTEKDLSISTMNSDVESVAAVTTKGLSGMNSDRSYSLDKRTYDESMLNILGMSTGFAGNVGVTRQATIDMNVQGEKGYLKSIDGDASQLTDVKTLTITEAVTPFSATHDDPFRGAMNYVQNSKHSMRVAEASPLLVTSGADEAMPYMCSDRYAHKAKGKGTVTALTDDYMVIDYDNKNIPSEFIDLDTKVEKNSDGGFHIPLKLDTDLKVGSRVKEGDIVAYDRLSVSSDIGENNNLAYNTGVLAKVAILSTEEGFEDSAKVSDRLSKAMATDVVKVREVTLPKNTNVYNILPVGSPIREGDPLIVFQTPFDSEDLQVLQRNLAAEEGDDISTLGRIPIKAETTGTLIDIRIYRTVEIKELSPSLQKLVKAYEKPILEKKKVMEEHGIPTYTLPPTYKLPATGKLKHADDGVLIEFCQQYTDILAVGDKLVWKSANKGVNKGIFPVGEEPYTEMRPNEVIDGFITNTSINGRMVNSIGEYGALAKLMIELARTCKDMAGIPYDDSKV